MLDTKDIYWINTEKDLEKFKSFVDTSHKDVALDVETYTRPNIKRLIEDKDPSLSFSAYLSKVRLIQIGVAESIELEPSSELSAIERSFWVPKQNNFRCFLIDTHITQPSIIKAALDYLNERDITVVGHEIKFDISQLYINYNWLPNKTFCTLTASQLLGHATGSTSVGQLGRSLKDLCKDLLSRPGKVIDLDKTEQKSDWSGVLTPSQIQYAVLDTYYLLILKVLLARACNYLGMQRDLELEQSIVVAVAIMELNGLKLDMELYQRIIELAKREISKLKVEIATALQLPLQRKTMFGFSKNESVPIDEKIFSSPKRLKEVLLKVGIVTDNLQAETLKLVLDVLTDQVDSSNRDELDTQESDNNYEEENDNSTDVVSNLVTEFNLSKEDKIKLINNILRIKALNKLLGNKYDRFINPITGKIHPRFNQGRAQTGRFACTNPNLQALAKDGIFDPDNNQYYSLREIIKADGEWVTEGSVTYWSGYVLCARDIDRQELVVAAYLSGDTNLKNAIESGEDLHTTHALMAWPELDESQVKQPYAKLGGKKPRDKAKTIIYGLLYGQNPLIMATNMGLSEQEGKSFYERLRARYPQLFDWLDSIAEFGIKHRWVRYTKNGFVTRRRFLAGNAKGMTDNNTLARLSKNSPIQGISASQAKNMLRMLFDYIRENNLYDELKICGQIHDEFILQLKGKLYLACSIKNYINSKEKRVDQYIQYIPYLEKPGLIDKVSEILSEAGGQCIEYKLKVNTGSAFAPYWAKD
jgi:DNA polymerase-1